MLADAVPVALTTRSADCPAGFGADGLVDAQRTRAWHGDDIATETLLAAQSGPQPAGRRSSPTSRCSGSPRPAVRRPPGAGHRRAVADIRSSTTAPSMTSTSTSSSPTGGWTWPGTAATPNQSATV